MSQEIADIKTRIWIEAKQDLKRVNKSIVATSHRSDTPEWWERVLMHLQCSPERKKPKRRDPMPKQCWDRYTKAYHAYQATNFPTWVKDGHTLDPRDPGPGSNGLTTFIINYLTWAGHFANRTGNEGRVIVTEGKAQRIKSSSKRGMQDIDSNLKHSKHQFGIPWKIEIKVGGDWLKDAQVKYGEQVSRTGGVYSVVRNVEDFFEQLDNLLS